ncbi:hypothetical protein ACLOJK_008585 [Asimina triloba]
MGCVFCKDSAIEDSRESPKERVPPSKYPTNGRIAAAASSSSSSLRREEIVQGKGGVDGCDGRVVVFERKQSNGVIQVDGEISGRKRERHAYDRHLSIGTLPKASEGEQVAAGWPAWLVAVAGEAIRGWVPRRADSFEKLDKFLPDWQKRFCMEGTAEILNAKDVNGPVTGSAYILMTATSNWGNLHTSAPPEKANEFPPYTELVNFLLFLGLQVNGSHIGQGTYSNVYRARDLDNGKIVALKKVRFDNLEPESVRFMAREIHILRRLDHPNIIKLEGLVTSRMSCSLYLVFEYMEHDLAGLASCPGVKFSEPQVKCYMQQLLRGLDHCHSRNILHRDIKGSNLLIDNSGVLKIADFGLASFFDPDRRHPLTSRVVTLWYRPPELLLGATDYGVAVDLWSAGCILAELYAGKPIMPGRTEVEQLHKIFKLCGSPSEEYWRKSKLPHATIFKPQHPYRRCVGETFKDFPPPALELLEVLLSVDPADRGTAFAALNSEFFTTKPLACDPSSLPKYPPSKEFDAKMRDEEARRQAALGGKLQRNDQERKGRRESRAIPAPDANAELASSLQRRQGQSSSKSRSEKFNPHEEVASGFPIDPPRQSHALEEANEASQMNFPSRASHSGPLVHRGAWTKAQKNEDGVPKVLAGADLSAFSGLVAARRRSDDRREKSGPSQSDASNTAGRLQVYGTEGPEPPRRRDPSPHAKEDGKMGIKDPISLGYGPKGNKIHYSGPLLRPSGNVDQMLKDHDRHVQEAVRRARLDKARMRKLQPEGGNHPQSRPCNGGSGFPIIASSGPEAGLCEGISSNSRRDVCEAESFAALLEIGICGGREGGRGGNDKAEEGRNVDDEIEKWEVGVRVHHDAPTVNDEIHIHFNKEKWFENRFKKSLKALEPRQRTAKAPFQEYLDSARLVINGR